MIPAEESTDSRCCRADAAVSGRGSAKRLRMEQARVRLEAERRQTFARLADLSADFDAVVAASRDTNADDEHDLEGATIAFERSQVQALVRQAREHLAEIEAAMERLGASTYGICEECGRPIAEGRLEARPVARTCISCAGKPP